MLSYKQLVRDRIPEIIEANEKKLITHILNEATYLSELDRKLNNESAKKTESKSQEELANMQKEMYVIIDARVYSIAELEIVRSGKAAKRGESGNHFYLKAWRLGHE